MPSFFDLKQDFKQNHTTNLLTFIMNSSSIENKSKRFNPEQFSIKIH